jgi:hypothetical protein
LRSKGQLWLGHLPGLFGNEIVGANLVFAQHRAITSIAPTDATPLRKRTPTNLYNRHPDWLAASYAVLERTVLDAYGWPHHCQDDEILARLLLVLNGERAAAQPGAAPASTMDA